MPTSATPSPHHRTPMGAAYAAHTTDPAPPGSDGLDFTAPPPSYFALAGQLSRVRGAWPELGTGWWALLGRLAAYRARVHGFDRIITAVHGEVVPLTAVPMGGRHAYDVLEASLLTERRRTIYAYGTAAHYALTMAMEDADPPAKGLPVVEHAAVDAAADRSAAALAQALLPLMVLVGLTRGSSGGPPEAVAAAAGALPGTIDRPRDSDQVHNADNPAFAEAVLGFADAVAWSLCGAVSATRGQAAP